MRCSLKLVGTFSTPTDIRYELCTREVKVTQGGSDHQLNLSVELYTTFFNLRFGMSNGMSIYVAFSLMVGQ